MGAGAAAVAAPLAAGMRMVLHPLWEGGGEARMIRIAPLNALPSDGKPRRFPVIADRQDAWNHYRESTIGQVFLRRTAPREVHAFQVICPHAGCHIEYDPEKTLYICPCHASTFGLDGSIEDPASPSRRPMDSLGVEIRNGAIWVRFQKFQVGVPNKVAV